LNSPFWFKNFAFILILSFSSCKSNAQPIWKKNKPINKINNDINLKDFLSHIQYIVHFLESYPKQFSKQLSLNQRIGLIKSYKILLQSKNNDDLELKLSESFYCFKASEEAFVTGYYSPVYKASLTKHSDYIYPLYKKPKDLKDKDDRYKRINIDKEGVLKNKSLEILWLKDPFDVFLLHVQGSASLELDNNKIINVGVDATNGLKYTSIGKYLVDTGAIAKDEISLKSIRKYFLKNPKRLLETLLVNDRYVFFKTQKHRAKGSTGSEVLANHSIAVEKENGIYSLPPLSLFNISFKKSKNYPLANKEFLVFVQDTGAAIKGDLRLDLYLGSGKIAGKRAGELQHKASLFFYWPKNVQLPKTKSLKFN